MKKRTTKKKEEDEEREDDEEDEEARRGRQRSKGRRRTKRAKERRMRSISGSRSHDSRQHLDGSAEMLPPAAQEHVAGWHFRRARPPPPPSRRPPDCRATVDRGPPQALDYAAERGRASQANMARPACLGVEPPALPSLRAQRGNGLLEARLSLADSGIADNTVSRERASRPLMNSGWHQKLV